MAKYNILIDTDGFPDNEAGVQKVTADYNAALVAADPLAVPLTVEEYLTRVLTIAVSSYSVVAIKEETDSLARKFEKADPTERQAVRDALAGVAGGGGGGQNLDKLTK